MEVVEPAQEAAMVAAVVEDGRVMQVFLQCNIDHALLVLFFQAEDRIRYGHVTGVQTCALPISPCARGVGDPGCRATPGGPGPGQRAPRPEAGRRAGGGRRAAGTGARRRVVDRGDSPLRGPRGGAGDRAGPGSRAWSGRLAPSAGCDAPRPAGARSPGSGSRGPGGAARAAAPGEWR